MPMKMKCDLCGTQQSDGYSIVAGLGLLCERCEFLNMGSADMINHRHCPKPYSDMDPEALRIQENGMEPLTEEEYDAWAKSNGNPKAPGTEKVRQMFSRKKIEKWFKEHGENGQVRTGLSETPFTYQLLQQCACKVPPTEVDIPGIDIEMAKAAITAFRLLIFTGQEVFPTEVSGTSSTETCGFCGAKPSESSRLLNCGRCKKIKYCSKECQKNHWKQHKPSCKAA